MSERKIDFVDGDVVLFLSGGVAVRRDGVGMYRVDIRDEPHTIQIYYHAGVGFININDNSRDTRMRLLLPRGLGSNLEDDIVSAMLELEILSQINSDKAQKGKLPDGWAKK